MKLNKGVTGEVKANGQSIPFGKRESYDADCAGKKKFGVGIGAKLSTNYQSVRIDLWEEDCVPEAELPQAKMAMVSKLTNEIESLFPELEELLTKLINKAEEMFNREV